MVLAKEGYCTLDGPSLARSPSSSSSYSPKTLRAASTNSSQSSRSRASVKTMPANFARSSLGPFFAMFYLRRVRPNSTAADLTWALSGADFQQLSISFCM